MKDELSVTHPKHYAEFPATCPECKEGLEPIDLARHLGFNLGNVVKYVCRAGRKGDVLDDLMKARFYLEDQIELESKKSLIEGEPCSRDSHS